MAGGRPTKYKKEYNKQVYKLALLGATDKEMADFLEVDEATLNLWKKKEPEFYESLKKGKIKADIDIANSLRKRAEGYTHKEVKKEYVYNDLLGEKVLVSETETEKKVHPDVAAINIWLKNRRHNVKKDEGVRWADKHEVEHSGGLEYTVVVQDNETKGNLDKLKNADD